ncbi:FAD dependent oxidoreductase [Lojkania enalia]|uniref:FAD dependent oxidoreductase n=1 Tax=Lojkania enalia TaxID=147567 RepID=A0A9P4N671_9PLEO|nr:FAD dependent oxidoreductase [Didymosphaeria enalia]
MASCSSSFEAPSSILIIGSGVFGLSTAYELCKNDIFKNTSITLVDRQPFPAPDSSSIDTSRIVRADYASAPYSRLAAAAQNLWRTTFAPQHYHENGLCITASGPEQKYVSESLANVQSLATCKIEVLKNSEDIKRVTGIEKAFEDACGSLGYVNWSSGWVDAEGAMRWLRSEVEKFNRVCFITGTVTRLIIDHTTQTVSGVRLKDSTPLVADLTILAAGAWTPSLLDMRGIAKATGQILVYLPVTPTEQANLQHRPTLLNLSTGLFLLPPHNNLLKTARHGHGYTNPTTIPHPESASPSATLTVSLPSYHTVADSPVPPEGLHAARTFLASVHPSLATPSRPFAWSRVCWYLDTRSGDFIIDHHPDYKGLFVATGGNGHAFKFLPVLGDMVVKCLTGKIPEDFCGLWEWPRERVAEEEWKGDGSRGGPVGMVLGEEMVRAVSRL